MLTNRFLLTLSLLAFSAVSANAQHMHVVPHTTTHYDTYRHGNHTHTVPHTTTHYDQVLPGSSNYVPHTTTHFDTYRHGNHTHTVPHTTTHLDPVYPSTYGAGYRTNYGSVYVPSYGSNYGLNYGANYGSNYGLNYGSSYGLNYGSNYSSNYGSGYSSVYGSGLNSGINSGIGYYSTPAVGSTLTAPATSGVVTSAPSPALGTNYSASRPVISGGAVASSIAPNTIPSKPATSASTALKTIVLTNPSSTGGDVRYAVNEFTYNIGAGQSQTLKLDREWTIRFENGLGRQMSYRLSEGKYQFSVSPDKGWDVSRVEEGTVAPAPPAPVAEPKDDSSKPKRQL